MDPLDTKARYNKLASFWQKNTPESYGMAQLDRAFTFTSKTGFALDVGCGSQGRFVNYLTARGYSTEGVDISDQMIKLAREQSPHTVFYEADICEWQLPRKYEFISAWDSTFHLPLDKQAPVLIKLCEGLMEGGILIFTCGGGQQGEITGEFENLDFGYSTLGVEKFVQILHECGCCCRHVEYDQYPEKHVYIIAEKLRV